MLAHDRKSLGGIVSNVFFTILDVKWHSNWSNQSLYVIPAKTAFLQVIGWREYVFYAKMFRRFCETQLIVSKKLNFSSLYREDNRQVKYNRRFSFPLTPKRLNQLLLWLHLNEGQKSQHTRQKFEDVFWGKDNWL